MKNKFESKRKENVLAEIRESFSDIKKQIEMTKESTFNEAQTSYYNKRLLNKQWREILDKIDQLHTEIEHNISMYFDRPHEYILKHQQQIIVPLTDKYPEIKPYLKKLIKEFSMEK